MGLELVTLEEDRRCHEGQKLHAKGLNVFLKAAALDWLKAPGYRELMLLQLPQNLETLLPSCWEYRRRSNLVSSQPERPSSLGRAPNLGFSTRPGSGIFLMSRDDHGSGSSAMEEGLSQGVCEKYMTGGAE